MLRLAWVATLFSILLPAPSLLLCQTLARGFAIPRAPSSWASINAPAASIPASTGFPSLSGFLSRNGKNFFSASIILSVILPRTSIIVPGISILKFLSQFSKKGMPANKAAVTRPFLLKIESQLIPCFLVSS